MRSFVFRVLLVISAVCVVGSARDAAAFRLIGAAAVDGTYCAGDFLTCGSASTVARWFEFNVPFSVNNNFAIDAGDPGLTQADAISAIQAGYQSWEDVPFSIIRFTYQGQTGNRVNGFDGTNTSVCYNAAFDAGACTGWGGIPGGTLAITILTEIAASGEITDADIVYDNADTWIWDTSCGSVDLQSVATHENGHSIGIHHTELPAGNITTRPTMFGNYACDVGVASLRSLEPDDQQAVQCLYPELPTLVLIDQTGSMAANTRMPDAQAGANAFIDAFADNVMAVAGFGDTSPSCPTRPGYELLQDYTVDAGLLHDAVDSTFPCGATPLWESTCCAITKAMEAAPANLLVYTDTGENSSDGECGCFTFQDVLSSIDGSQVTVYVIDMTNYVGPEPFDGPAVNDDLPNANAQGGDDSSNLSLLCEITGGVYTTAKSFEELQASQGRIQRHIAEKGQLVQNESECQHGGVPISSIQNYSPDCSPLVQGQQVSIEGIVSAERGLFDANTQYVQNCSGGVQVFGNVGPFAARGDKVVVTGQVSEIFGEIRINPVFDVSIIGNEPPLEAPILDPLEGNLCGTIGKLMSVRGFAVDQVINDRFEMTADIGDLEFGSLVVFIDPDTDIDPDMIQKNGEYVVTGVMSRRLGQNELKPRDEFDIQTMTTGIDDAARAPGVISGIQSLQPNPFRSQTRIDYSLAVPGEASVRVFDVQGRSVRVLVDGALAADTYTIEWDGRTDDGARAASGIYFVRLTGPNGVVDTREMLLVR